MIWCTPSSPGTHCGLLCQSPLQVPAGGTSVTACCADHANTTFRSKLVFAIINIISNVVQTFKFLQKSPIFFLFCKSNNRQFVILHRAFTYVLCTFWRNFMQKQIFREILGKADIFVKTFAKLFVFAKNKYGNQTF